MIYKKQKLYYYEKIDNISLEDIKKYVNENFGFKDIKITFENNILINKKNNHRFIRPIKSNFFKLYLLYLLILCLGFYFYENKKHKTSSISKISQDMKKIKKDMKFEYVSKALIDIYEKANEEKLEIISVKLIYSKFELKIKATKKDYIYAFVKHIKNCKIEKIEYDKNHKGFISNVSF